MVPELQDVDANVPEVIVSEDRLLDYFESRTHRGAAAGESARVSIRVGPTSTVRMVRPA